MKLHVLTFIWLVIKRSIMHTNLEIATNQVGNPYTTVAYVNYSNRDQQSHKYVTYARKSQKSR